MEKNISISVVITTFNRPICFLEQALESVLLQTLKPLEIIIIDDNSNKLFSNSVQFYCQSKKLFMFIIPRNTELALQGMLE